MRSLPENIFREYLADWEFGGEWRPFVERLAELADGAGEPARTVLNSCSVWPWPAPRGPREGLTVWTDVAWPDRRVQGHQVAALSLAAVLDDHGLRCGRINGSCVNDPDGADLSWQSYPPGGHTLPGLAALAAAWLTAQAQRPVTELLARPYQSAFHRRRGGPAAG